MDMTAGYNERLFSGRGFRNYYHTARYRWVARQLAKSATGPLRIVELGCFDGKLLDFLPETPARYLGVDANWENGLDLGRQRYARLPEVSFVESRTADALKQYGDGEFNVAVALETLEHIPHEMMLQYLEELSRITCGWLFVSVPNEMGLVFVAKHVAKKLKYGGNEKYTAKEFIGAAFRKVDWVQRDEHKGFDYRKLIRDINRNFEVVSVEGMPIPRMRPSLSLTVGISAVSRA